MSLNPGTSYRLFPRRSEECKTSLNKIFRSHLGSRGLRLVSRLFFMALMIDVIKHPATIYRQVVCDAVSRRVAPWRRKIREGRIFRFLPFTLRPFAHPPPPALAHPLSFIPDAFEFTSATPEGSLARLGVLMYRRARIRITPRKTRWSMFRDRLERVADAYSRMG